MINQGAMLLLAQGVPLIGIDRTNVVWEWVNHTNGENSFAFEDVGKADPCEDGDPCYWFKDQQSGLYLKQATLASRPDFNHEVNGIYAGLTADGAASHMQSENNINSQMADTVGAWHFVFRSASEHVGMLANIGNNNNNDYYCSFFVTSDSGQKTRVFFKTTSGQFAANSTSTISTGSGAWHIWTVIQNGTAMSFLIDGSSDTVDVTSGSNDGNDWLSLVNDPVEDQFLNILASAQGGTPGNFFNGDAILKIYEDDDANASSNHTIIKNYYGI